MVEQDEAIHASNNHLLSPTVQDNHELARVAITSKLSNDNVQ